MFGYIQPLKSELKVRELETFKAYYCTLCKVIGKNYGKRTQFLIRYDCAFLGLLLDSLRDVKPAFRKGRCAYNPFRKKALLVDNPAIRYAADINMLLAYHKILDDFHDSHSIKSTAALIPFSRPGKKTYKRLQNTANTVKECIAKQSELERAKCSDVDEASLPMAQMLAAIFQNGCKEEHAECMYRIGFNLGRWVYLIDALDDLSEDVKKGNYNLFAEKYGKDCLCNEKALEEIRFSLEISLSMAEQAYRELPIRHNKGILDNVLYAGVLQKTKEVLTKKELKE